MLQDVSEFTSAVGARGNEALIHVVVHKILLSRKVGNFDEPRAPDLPERLGIVVEFHPVHIGIGAIGIDEDVFADSNSDLAGAVIQRMF